MAIFGLAHSGNKLIVDIETVLKINYLYRDRDQNKIFMVICFDFSFPFDIYRCITILLS